MKLIIAVVQDQDAGRLIEVLVEEGFGATKLASTGGFLKQGNTTLLVGVDEDKVPHVVDVVRRSCYGREQLVTPLTAVGRSIPLIPKPVQIPVGGATLFVIDVEEFEKA
ncbi:MAG: cyclic-di-AMP receptor [Firmicutes bacterium]|nr:cyclic-di-AMP receptor [Bacillota bacterium]